MSTNDTSSARWTTSLVGLSVLAAVAFAAAFSSSVDDPASGLLEALVGSAFLTAAALARGAAPQRILVAAVGVAWFLGALPALLGLHHAVLAVALLAFPSGRLRGGPSWALAAATLPAAIGALSQLGLAALFAGVGAVTYGRLRDEAPDVRYPVLAAGSLAVLFGSAGTIAQLWPHAYRSHLTLVAYEVVLLLVAGGFPIAVRRTLDARARALHRPLLDAEPEGLDAIAAVLGHVLGDRRLRVHRPAAEAPSGDPNDAPLRAEDPRDRILPVVDAGRGHVATVTYRTRSLDDPATQAAVASAVRLAVANLDLRREQEAQLAALEAARARLVDAGDRSRARTAAELHHHVETSLARAAALLREPDPATAPSTPAAIRVARDELEGAAAEIATLVAGVPPAGLGDGRLNDSLAELVRRCPVASSLVVDGDVAGSVEAEEALFYVCSEALTNVVKHAHATHVRVEVRRAGAVLVATISDDGCGGADAAGTGLQGLADRLAARGGRLLVHGGPGAGTTITASVPT